MRAEHFGCATGQEVQPWHDPFDSDALRAAIPYYLEDDLSDYNFSLLLVVQNKQHGPGRGHVGGERSRLRAALCRRADAGGLLDHTGRWS